MSASLWPQCLNDDDLEDVLRESGSIHPYSRQAVFEEVIRRWRKRYTPAQQDRPQVPNVNGNYLGGVYA